MLKESFDNSKSNGTNDTYSTFKAFEEGSETLSKESNTLLASRQEKFIRDLKYALIRIENKTYGVCRKTGKLISKKDLSWFLTQHFQLRLKNKVSKTVSFFKKSIPFFCLLVAILVCCDQALKLFVFFKQDGGYLSINISSFLRLFI